VLHAAGKGHGKVANAMGEGERHGEKRMQLARGEVAARGTEAEARGRWRVRRSKGHGRWNSVIGSEHVGFCMEEATYLYFYFFQF